MTETLLLVDAYSQIYRAFYAIRHLTDSQGRPANALYGFTKMLRKLAANHRPTHCGVVFDVGAPRKRLALLPSYKEQRPPTPPDLEAQLPAIREMLTALRIPTVELDGEEADDIIATLAAQADQAAMNVLIASNDKDFAQLVNGRIALIRPGDKEDVVFDAAAVEAKFGLRPSLIVDYLSLLGDSVDNIRGVPGVGEKTAVELLRQFGSLDQVLSRTAEIQRPKLREALVASLAQLHRNQQLVRLDVHLALPVSLAQLKVQAPDYPRLISILQGHGFKSLLAEITRESQASGDLFTTA
jgi:DNA polymerase-1